jgi:O-antigen/teichoic acid export membrane protein
VDTLQVNYHQYAVSHHFDAATFAVYSVGCFQIPLMELVASPMANVMMVRMMEGIREGRGEDALAVWAGTTRALALLFFPAVALLVVAAPDLIVFLFTESYRGSVPVFVIWSLSVALSAMPTDGALRVYAATRFLLVLGLLRLVLIAASIGAFLRMFGLRGAVLVTVTVAVIAKAASLVRLGSLMHVRLARLLPWRDLMGIAVLAAAAALPALAVRSAVVAPHVFRLALTGLVYGVGYLATLFHSSLLAESEKRALRDRLALWPAAATAGESGG